MSGSLLRALWRGKRGATAIEYAMIAAMIGLAIVAGATLVGSALADVFLLLASKL